VSWEYRAQLLSGEPLRVEAAIDPEIGSILPAARPAEPPASPATAAAPRNPGLETPAETLDPKEASVPPQPTQSIGGQGWIIERK